LSGEGAARHGGRWNRPGQPALYLSETIQTAFAEYQQELGFRPGTFVAYDVSGAVIADLATASDRDRLDVSAADLLTPWKEAAFVAGTEPITWRIADRFAADHHGLRVPSAQNPGGVNIVLWRWNGPDAPRMTYFDPGDDLPRPNPP
jgi:RES domain-containing protein